MVFEKSIEENITPQDKFLVQLNLFLKEKFLLLVLYGIIFSYFYNLPVLKYSIKGDNELRIYDVLGIFLIYYFYKYNKFVLLVIKNILFLKMLYRFMIWACITCVTSLFFFIINDALVSFLQVILYMYHFWIFYLAAVFFYIFCLDKAVQKIGIYLILIFSLACNFIVILQNLGIVKFLFNDVYKKAYLGFLSGTLGPNKIVLGMTSLFCFSLCLGVLLEKKIVINRLLLYLCIIINIYIIFISGSRTTYLGLIIILLFFALRSPLKFVFVSSFFSLLFITTLSYNPDLYKSLEDTLENRIFSKVSIPEEEEVGVGDLYSDLGAGRDRLTIGNAIYILENPQIIPFGAGFINRFDKAPGLSAHNMYLQVIKETGLVGFYLYFGWLVSYLFIKFDKYRGFSLALNGLVLAMLATLFFGEHLYIYRPLFGLLGLFLIITVIFVSALHKIEIK